MENINLPLNDAELEYFERKSQELRKCVLKLKFIGQVVILTLMVAAILADPQSTWGAVIVVCLCGFFVYVIYSFQMPIIALNRAGFVYRFEGHEFESSVDGSELYRTSYDEIDGISRLGSEVLERLQAIGRKPIALEVEIVKKLSENP